MKISPDSLQRLHHDLYHALNKFRLSPDAIVTMTDAWDVFHMAKGTWLYAEGLNDKHIETALRRIFPSIR